MDEPLLEAKGISGQLLLFEDHIRIQRKGLLAKLNTNRSRSDIDIPIGSITSVELKKAGLTEGYISFSYAGSRQGRASWLSPNEDEDTVTFSRKSNDAFEQMRSRIQERMRDYRTPSGGAPMAPMSPADEVRKLAELRDAGILTEDEFQAKKKQLLGL